MEDQGMYEGDEAHEEAQPPPPPTDQPHYSAPPPVKSGANITIRFSSAPPPPSQTSTGSISILKRKRDELEEDDLWAANLLEGRPADYSTAPN